MTQEEMEARIIRLEESVKLMLGLREMLKKLQDSSQEQVDKANEVLELLKGIKGD